MIEFAEQFVERFLFYGTIQLVKNSYRSVFSRVIFSGKVSESEAASGFSKKQDYLNWLLLKQFKKNVINYHVVRVFWAKL